MPLVSKKDLIRYLINYTYKDDLEAEILGKYFEKIFGISDLTMHEIFKEKHKLILNNKEEISCYIDFNEMTEMIRKHVEENYK